MVWAVFDPEGYLRILSRMRMERSMTPQEKAVMARLYDWRDKVHEELVMDKSVFLVIGGGGGQMPLMP